MGGEYLFKLECQGLRLLAERKSPDTNASYNMVKSNELIKIWLKSCSTTLKSVNVLGN